MKKLATVLLAVSLLLMAVPNRLSADEQPKLTHKIVKVKYINADYAFSMLIRYCSKYGKIDWVRESNTLIIEDTPEVVEKILSILKEIDVKPADMVIVADLILGSTRSAPEASTERDLQSDPLVKELQDLLKFRSFRRLDSSIIKIQDNTYSQHRLGGKEGSFRLDLKPHYIQENKGDVLNVELRLFQIKGMNPDGKEISTTLITTTLTLKSGERTVVGVSKLDGGDSALILILSGKVVKG